MARTQRVESKREQEKKVDELVTRGFKIKQQSEYTARLKEKDWGDLPIHGFVLIFTFIIAALLFDAANLPSGGVWVAVALANITYAGYSWFTAEEIIIKVTQDKDG